MTSIAWRRASLLALTLLALGACSSNSTPPTPTDAAGAPLGDGVRRDPVVAGRRARVFIMAGFGASCESLAAPTIVVTQAPSKGAVSFEPGQETTINTSASGTCIGQRVIGTGIYYTARPGETGADSFAVEAELGGAVTARSFTVQIVN